MRLAQLRFEGIEGWENEHSEWLKERGIFHHSQIHDELLAYHPDNKKLWKESLPHVKHIMENPFEDIPEKLGIPLRRLSVPLDIDAGLGTTWAEAH